MPRALRQGPELPETLVLKCGLEPGRPVSCVAKERRRPDRKSSAPKDRANSLEQRWEEAKFETVQQELADAARARKAKRGRRRRPRARLQIPKPGEESA